MGNLGRKPGFSLVELVIVVVILGIIAAVAVPRLSRGSKAASVGALLADLHALRTAIDSYAAEQGNEWPASSPPDRNEAAFIDQLTNRTNTTGEVGTTAGEHIYGPYLRNIPPIPVGPNVGAGGVELRTSGEVLENKPIRVGFTTTRQATSMPTRMTWTKAASLTTHTE